jgi:hypothetical protein
MTKLFLTRFFTLRQRLRGLLNGLLDRPGCRSEFKEFGFFLTPAQLPDATEELHE